MSTNTDFQYNKVFTSIICKTSIKPIAQGQRKKNKPKFNFNRNENPEPIDLKMSKYLKHL